MRNLLIAMILMIHGITGCAAKQPAQAKPAHGVTSLRHTVWKDCVLRGDRVECRCSAFNLFTNAKGETELRCAQ